MRWRHIITCRYEKCV